MSKTKNPSKWHSENVNYLKNKAQTDFKNESELVEGKYFLHVHLSCKLMYGKGFLSQALSMSNQMYAIVSDKLNKKIKIITNNLQCIF